MKTYAATGIVLALMISGAGYATITPPTIEERNFDFLLEQLRIEAARNGQELPDLAGQTAQGFATDPATGELVPVEIPAEQALMQVASLFGERDLRAIVEAEGDLPPPSLVMGVGDNLHLYLGLRFGRCNTQFNYNTKFSSAPITAPPVNVPTPPPVTVQGGPVRHITGAGWNVLGLHLFLGFPAGYNVNVNTGGVPPASPLLGVGTDSSIDTVGFASTFMVSIPIRFFTICLLSIDIGTMVQDGAMRVNGELIPGQLPI